MIHEKNKSLATIILAAGQGKRMKSSLAKVMHPLCGNPMLTYPVEVAKAVGSEKIVVIAGHQADLVKKSMEGQDLIFVNQKKQLGTGHAVLQAKEALKDFSGNILILCGDVPLLLPSTVRLLLENHIKNGEIITVLTVQVKHPHGYGRIIKGTADRVMGIVEEKDASEEERLINEVNTGIYCVDSNFLFKAVQEIDNKNAQKEYYLTDIFGIANKNNYSAQAFLADDYDELMGINTQAELLKAEKIMQKRAEVSG